MSCDIFPTLLGFAGEGVGECVTYAIRVLLLEGI